MQRTNFGGLDGGFLMEFRGAKRAANAWEREDLRSPLRRSLCGTKAKRWPSATEGHFELPCNYESKRILVQNLSYENELDLYENETVEETHLDMKGFETRFDKEAEGN